MGVSSTDPNQMGENFVPLFETILKQMRYISEIPGIDDVEPMTFPFDVSIDCLREDIPLQIYSREEILKNAHSKKDDQIELPKVVK